MPWSTEPLRSLYDPEGNPDGKPATAVSQSAPARPPAKKPTTTRATGNATMPANTKATRQRQHELAIARFESLIESELRADPTLTRPQACAKAAKRDPEAHMAFIRATNPTKQF